ncbi:MAG: hypothetical protein CEE40_10540 [Chloroflexi bacterium B3_Chlor]|nr:MAG: hypothetical protein CEE40_10540 [Chloroflexi bacterium B3_Chlor]
MEAITPDGELIAALEEERKKSPELAQAIDLHHEVISTRAKIEAEAAHVKPDEREVATQVDERVPLMQRWELGWDQESFSRLSGQICDVGARHREDLAPQFNEIRSLLIEEPDQTQSIVTSHLREGKVDLPEHPDVDQQLLSFVLVNALHPFLQAHAAVLRPMIRDEKWYQKRCPVCGGEPDFGYLEEKVGGLRLLCSHCDTVWTYKRGECTFCGNSDKDSFFYYLGDDEAYRLYVCDKCKRYLKVLDGRQTASKPLLPLQRIITIGMDVSARQQGYR